MRGTRYVREQNTEQSSGDDEVSSLVSLATLPGIDGQDTDRTLSQDAAVSQSEVKQSMLTN